jgi:hypothetical protein
MKTGALLVAAAMMGCSSSSRPPPPPTDGGADAGGPAWQVVLQHLTGTLLCIWGTAPNDVFTVGGPRGNGTPTMALHYDGTAWKNLRPGGTETFWWTHGTSDHDVWMVGEQGRIAHWDGTGFTAYTSGTTATLYGVWAGASNDVWAVGGTPEGGTMKPNDVVLHFDGTGWTPSPLPQIFGRTYFKVWGTGSDNLYVVGEAGTVWHRIGTQWTLESNPPIATGTLLTVNGCGNGEVYAVGGRDVLRSDGKTWTRTNVMLDNDVNGVACRSPGNVVIVGFGGSKQRLVNGTWVDDFGSVPYSDLHGAWADSADGYWGVGGDFISMPQAGVSREGVVAYYGAIGAVSSTLAP